MENTLSILARIARANMQDHPQNAVRKCIAEIAQEAEIPLTDLMEQVEIIMNNELPKRAEVKPVGNELPR